MIECKQVENVVVKVSNDKICFIVIISYELRILFNGIVGFSCMLCDIELIQEQWGWVSMIYVSVIMLGNIFNDIIDMDKFECDKLELLLKMVLLCDFIEEFSFIICLLVVDKLLELIININDLLLKLVEVDGMCLCQILWNILFNVVKFIQKGYVILMVLVL